MLKALLCQGLEPPFQVSNGEIGRLTYVIADNFVNKASPCVELGIVVDGVGDL